MALNLLAPLYCAQAANAVMQGQAEGGSIVNITSVSGLRPSPGTAAYGAAKAGLINLTQTLAMEWAPKVRVNALCAGMVATEAADDHYGGPEGVAAVAATVPLGRLGTPGDMAAALPLPGFAPGRLRDGSHPGGPRRRRTPPLPGRGGSGPRLGAQLGAVGMLGQGPGRPGGAPPRRGISGGPVQAGQTLKWRHPSVDVSQVSRQLASVPTTGAGYSDRGGLGPC